MVIEVVIRIRIDHGYRGVIVDILITQPSPAPSDLQIVDKRDIEERLVAHAPASRDGREDPVAIVTAETRRAVSTNRSRKQIAIGIVVIHSSQNGLERIGRLP